MEAMAEGRFEFSAAMDDVQVFASGDPAEKGATIMRGHAAVFGKQSHDMGGFRIEIAPGAFKKVLDANPDVHLNREHDMRLLLARTRNGSLELREDPAGLHVYARLAPTQLAEETATLMRGGYLDQMSFACSYDTTGTTWFEDQSGDATMTINEFTGLFDVCVCAQGAFPQTDARLITASLPDAAAQFDRAKAEGLIKTSVAPDVGVGVEEQESIAPEAVGADVVADMAQGARDLAAFKRDCSARYALLTHPE